MMNIAAIHSNTSVARIAAPIKAAKSDTLLDVAASSIFDALLGHDGRDPKLMALNAKR